MYCRLGFAKKKGAENINTEELHPSWREIQPANKKYVYPIPLPQCTFTSRASNSHLICPHFDYQKHFYAPL